MPKSPSQVWQARVYPEDWHVCKHQSLEVVPLPERFLGHCTGCQQSVTKRNYLKENFYETTYVNRRCFGYYRVNQFWMLF